MDYILQTETYQIIGACMEVHKELGHGYNEAVYQEATEIEFSKVGIPFQKEAELTIDYKGVELRKTYCADFICFGKIILELKAVSKHSDEHVGQVLNYLKTANLNLGLLINFGTSSLQYKRIIF